MNHLILCLICISSIEIFIRSNYLGLLSSTVKVCKKSIGIILNKNISDHWKENIIPTYSLQMIKYSLQMIFVLLLITLLFLITEKFLNNFLEFTFSLIGIIYSILITFSYAYLRRLILK